MRWWWSCTTASIASIATFARPVCAVRWCSHVLYTWSEPTTTLSRWQPMLRLQSCFLCLHQMNVSG